MVDEYPYEMYDDESIANQFITQQFYYNDTFTLKELYRANYYDISKEKEKLN